jgi:hypothetical protein
LAEFLAADDELNLTDEPTQEKPNRQPRDNPDISVEIPNFIPNNFPSMNTEDDSVSTFRTLTRPRATSASIVNLKDTRNYNTTDPQIRLHTPHRPPTNQHHNTTREETDTISKLSETASRISYLKTNISALVDSFKNAFMELRLQAR